MNDSIPSNMAPLVGTSPTTRPADDMIECSVCGTLYSYTYTCGFGENDIVLRRITPVEAGYEFDVNSFKDDLTNPHDDTRAYAAQCLVEYYMSETVLNEVENLTNDADPVISSSAQASKNYYLYRKKLE